jgi:cytochrome c peroxidase
MMRLNKCVVILTVLCSVGLLGLNHAPEHDQSLIDAYKKPIEQWPAAQIDEGVDFQEFAPLPRIDTAFLSQTNTAEVGLGKLLFFDPILSASNQISCSSCHNPQMAWADKLTVALGHDHQEGNRNTPSLLNVHARKTLFWDGRARDLESQALSPIQAHHEMNMNPKELPEKLQAIKAYVHQFQETYGTDTITLSHILKALAAFQRTIVSRRSRFDEFLDGKYSAMTDQEIRGMHLFRTKARCINCHHGPFLTDESFHNIGLTYYKRERQDLGRYEITKDPEDVGKFRTPSLRDVMNTGPWMHNGLFGDMTGLLNMYNSGLISNSATPEQKAADPLYPVNDPLMQKLSLTKAEIQDLKAFMEAITAVNYRMARPEKLPR